MSEAGSVSLNSTIHEILCPKSGDELRCRRQHQDPPLTPSSPTRNSLPCEGRFSDPARRSKTALERSRNLLDVYCTPTRSYADRCCSAKRGGLVRSSTLNRSVQVDVSHDASGHESATKSSGTNSPCSWMGGMANVTASSGPICRICHEGEQSGPLLSYCLCSGTMGLVHSFCLERWLCSSNTDVCELCHRQFPTVLHRRPFKEWISEDGQRRALMTDLLCFALLSPVAVLGSNLCVRGASQQAMLHHAWQAGSLILLSCLLLGAFLVWSFFTLRHHYRAFRRWQRENPRFKVVALKGKGGEMEAKDDTASTTL